VDEEAIFTAALERATPEQRLAFVKQACAGDADLQKLVERLLQAHDHPDSFLQAPGANLVATADERVCERPGIIIGPYKLLEQIGEGGMGLVFMAEQAQPIRRRVALKILKPGMDTRQVIARFEAERQALALMDHSHIAKIFDAGTTDSGRPYFVIELVRGVPITEYCDERRLTTRQRLELFVTVCQAVQHAHQKGVIHRDLKPSNVLVSHHDTVAVPKIIDFGIAKATGAAVGGLTDRTLFTNFTLMLGTPLYMSPEQAEMNGLDVDTRSDVYSLGVMLYELLTGTTPFASDALKKVGPDEMRRIIREEEPPPPSTRLGKDEGRRMKDETCRSGRTRWDWRSPFSSFIPHPSSFQELDWIVMRALEKDRDRRYESASAFAADVQRYLNDEAVEACPPSAGYRLRKYVRRNRRVLMPLTGFVLVLAVATGVSTWQAIRAHDAQLQAETDRDWAKTAETQAKTAEAQAKIDQNRAEIAEKSARNEAAIARAVNAFLQEDLLGQVATAPPLDRELERDRLLTVKEALDRAAAKIGQRFQDQPLVEAAIRMAIGTGYDALKEWQLVVPHIRRALELRKIHLGPDHPDTLASMDKLAQAYMWVAQHQASIALRQQLWENRKAILGPDHPETLSCIALLGDAYLRAGQVDMSCRLLDQLLEKQRSIYGATHPGTQNTMLLLAWGYGLMNRFADSIALFDEYFTLRNDTFGTGYRSGMDLNWFVEACQWAGKFDQADGPLREAIAHARKGNGSVAERNELANSLGFLAVNLLLQGRYDEAEPLAREAVAMRQGGDVKRYYWVSALGAVLLGKHKYAEAEPLMLQGYQGMKHDELADHPGLKRRMAEVAGWLVRLYEATNQPEEAREWREKIGVHAETKTPPKTKEAKPK
jgi:serine/threonine protein kinase/tetratricopeptide (TPR) repeat protein